MNFYYDLYGNWTQTVDPTRETDISPPHCTGGQVANWTGSGWVCALPVTPSTQPSPPAMIDAYDWYRGFTPSEVAAITTLALTDANARAFLHILEMSIAAKVHVVSNDPALAAGLNYLTTAPSSAPCLTAARAAQMLAMV